MATIGVAFADLLVSFCILAGLMIWYRFAPGWQMMFLPLFLLFGVLTTIGPALWMTALNVKYRDFRYVIRSFFSSGFTFHQWVLVLPSS